MMTVLGYQGIDDRVGALKNHVVMMLRHAGMGWGLFWCIHNGVEMVLEHSR